MHEDRRGSAPPVSGGLRVKIGFLQLRPQFGRVKDNVRAARSMLAGVTDATVVLPELFNTGYLFRNMEEVRDLAESTANGFTVVELKKVAVAQRLNLVFGMAEAKRHLLTQDPQAQAGLSLFGEAEKLLAMGKGMTRAH